MRQLRFVGLIVSVTLLLTGSVGLAQIVSTTDSATRSPGGSIVHVSGTYQCQDLFPVLCCNGIGVTVIQGKGGSKVIGGNSISIDCNDLATHPWTVDVIADDNKLWKKGGRAVVRTNTNWCCAESGNTNEDAVFRLE